MKRFSTLCILLLFACACSDDDDSSPRSKETDLNLVTGIVIRGALSDPGMRLGNPNNIGNLQFALYPNPTLESFAIRTRGSSITDVWIVPAEERKAFEQTDFSTVLTPQTYAQADVERAAQETFLGLDTTVVILNVEDLSPGYYRVFVKIEDGIYVENIYLAGNNFDIQDIIDFWE